MFTVSYLVIFLSLLVGVFCAKTSRTRFFFLSESPLHKDLGRILRIDSDGSDWPKQKLTNQIRLAEFNLFSSRAAIIEIYSEC